MIRGIIYGPHNRLTEEHYHLELPDEDKPAYIGVQRCCNLPVDMIYFSKSQEIGA